MTNSKLTVRFIRKIYLINIILILLITLLFSCKTKHKEKSDNELKKMALKICENSIILDSHIDWPEWLLDNHEDISGRTLKGDFDLERAKKGGLNAALSVIYVSSAYDVEKGRIMADSMLKLVNYYVKTYPDKFALARNPNDVRKNFNNKLFSIILCMENGAPAGNDLGYFKYLKEKGIVYVTLCHNKVNQISDSNFDPDRKWKGLSPYGLEVIGELNRLGIMVDISHSTDSTVFQSLRYSKAPIIASHSSCRYFVPGLERDLSDTLIKAIAHKNGVVMINFGSMFLDSICLRNCNEAINWLDSKKIDMDSKEGIEYLQKFAETHKIRSNSKGIVDHIDHIVKIAGIDYVGIGSDFDGVGPSQPSDVPDVSGYPAIVCELLRRGYNEDAIKKILSGNFLRVWNNVIAIADSLNKNSTN
ncbi:MAG: dipeptidase [Bacteroidales bacterium]